MVAAKSRIAAGIGCQAGFLTLRQIDHEDLG
jgi:hypothetical protein